MRWKDISKNQSLERWSTSVSFNNTETIVRSAEAWVIGGLIAWTRREETMRRCSYQHSRSQEWTIGSVKCSQRRTSPEAMCYRSDKEGVTSHQKIENENKTDIILDNDSVQDCQSSLTQHWKRKSGIICWSMDQCHLKNWKTGGRRSMSRTIQQIVDERRIFRRDNSASSRRSSEAMDVGWGTAIPGVVIRKLY